MSPSRFKYIALLCITLPVVLLVVLLALTWAAFRQQQLDRKLIAAVQSNDTSKATQLLSVGADANATQDAVEPLSFTQTLQQYYDVLLGKRKPGVSAAGTPLLLIAANRSDEPLVRALLDHGARVDTVCTVPSDEVWNKGDTALLIASRSDQIRLVRLLLARHANVNAKDDDGFTALMATHTESIARMLLDHGADVHARVARGARKGETALFFALNNVTRDEVALMTLLLSHGASVEEKTEEGETILMQASAYSDVKGIDFLLDHGADIKATDWHGWTALMYASYPEGDEGRAVNELLRRGADPNPGNVEGKTALMLAAGRGNFETVQALIHARARLDARDHDGGTAITVAKREHSQECLRLLRAAGAKE